MADITCYGKAVQLLASSPHFRRELQTKLTQRGFPSEEISEALDRLVQQGYLDDARTAVAFVEQRLSRGTEGRLRLQAELEKRGAPREAIEAALASLVPEDDLEPAREAAERWARLHPRGKPASLAQHLARKGFSRRAIFAVLRQRPGAEGAGEEEDAGLDGFDSFEE
ncbi:MAG TPA: regulatory protein RecX [Thermoanaerobaculia bacterium]|nr:regulatory protein RecX [Thermoanaerobaculia bacterium]